jgi:hypothetical protein
MLHVHGIIHSSSANYPFLGDSYDHLLILLYNIVLRSTLLCLPNIVSLLRLQLRVSVTSQTSNSTAQSTRGAVCNAGTEVIELALSFLAFAFCVLLSTCSLQILL